MAYLTGVRSESYPPPTYPYHNARGTATKKNREGSRKHGIIIGLDELINNSNWLRNAEKFIGELIAWYYEDDLLRIMGRSRDPDNQNTLKEILIASKEDPSFPKIRGFTGFVCPQCLGIGIFEHLQDAGSHSLRMGSHVCILKDWMQVPEQFRTNEVSRQQLIERLHHVELPEMMLSLITLIEKRSGLKANIFFEGIGREEIGRLTSPIQLDYSIHAFTHASWHTQTEQNIRNRRRSDRSTILEFFKFSNMSTFATVRITHETLISRSHNIGIKFE
jgi:hypothetical protein